MIHSLNNLSYFNTSKVKKERNCTENVSLNKTNLGTQYLQMNALWYDTLETDL